MRVYIKVCKECGRTYEANAPNGGYCCEQCRKEAKSRKNKVYQKKYYKKRMEENVEPRACKWCGKVFTPDRKNESYCSPECAFDGYGGREHNRKKKEAAEKARRERESKERQKSLEEKIKYCKENKIDYGMMVAMRDNMFPTKKDILGVG